MSDSLKTKLFHQFFSTRPKISITMPNGNRIYFVGGTYLTDSESEIAFLNGEVAAGNSMIFVKKESLTVDADALDPLAAIKKKAIEEYISQQALNSDPNRDMGNTNTNIGDSIATTKSIAAISAGSIKK